MEMVNKILNLWCWQWNRNWHFLLLNNIRTFIVGSNKFSSNWKPWHFYFSPLFFLFFPNNHSFGDRTKISTLRFFPSFYLLEIKRVFTFNSFLKINIRDVSDRKYLNLVWCLSSWILFFYRRLKPYWLCPYSF